LKIVKRNGAKRWMIGALVCLPWLQAMLVSGGGSAPQSSDRRQEAKQSSAATTKRGTEHYDLGRDEEHGGHTLSRHVARSDAQLEERLQRERNISAASTWTDRETAEEVVAEALRSERRRVESWERRGYPRAHLALHFTAGRAIGRCWRRGESAPVACKVAVIVLRADGPGSFYVLTAYPEARE
jgi:Bacterial CdiA-CT RNAse A domain